jgi:hypothetical protein
MAPLSFEQLTAPVTDLADAASEALEEWRWLVPATAQPMLLTVLGDLFLQTSDGAIHFLDTASGTLVNVASSYEAWKRELQSHERIHHWFMPAFVAELLSAGITLGVGEIYSPIVPEVLGGALTVSNYTPSPWLAHFHMLGQVHRQVKHLPVGTPITRITTS